MGFRGYAFRVFLILASLFIGSSCWPTKCFCGPADTGTEDPSLSKGKMLLKDLIDQPCKEVIDGPVSKNSNNIEKAAQEIEKNSHNQPIKSKRKINYSTLVKPHLPQKFKRSADRRKVDPESLWATPSFNPDPNSDSFEYFNVPVGIVKGTRASLDKPFNNEPNTPPSNLGSNSLEHYKVPIETEKGTQVSLGKLLNNELSSYEEDDNEDISEEDNKKLYEEIITDLLEKYKSKEMIPLSILNEDPELNEMFEKFKKKKQGGTASFLGTY